MVKMSSMNSTGTKEFLLPLSLKTVWVFFYAMVSFRVIGTVGRYAVTRKNLALSISETLVKGCRYVTLWSLLPLTMPL